MSHPASFFSMTSLRSSPSRVALRIILVPSSAQYIRPSVRSSAMPLGIFKSLDLGPDLDDNMIWKRHVDNDKYDLIWFPLIPHTVPKWTNQLDLSNKRQQIQESVRRSTTASHWCRSNSCNITITPNISYTTGIPCTLKLGTARWSQNGRRLRPRPWWGSDRVPSEPTPLGRTKHPRERAPLSRAGLQ